MGAGVRLTGCRLIAFAAAFLATLGLTGSAMAFTVRGVKWEYTTPGYFPDASFTSYFVTGDRTAVRAANDWNSIATSSFRFIHTPGSSNAISNHRGPDDMPGCNRECLAVTGTGRSASGNIISFSVKINSNCYGTPCYAFYDGSQAPILPSTYYDLTTILRHEYGHAFGLCHTPGTAIETFFTQSSAKLMFFNLKPGQEKFVQDEGLDAINGNRYLYDASYVGPGPDGPCTEL